MKSKVLSVKLLSYNEHTETIIGSDISTTFEKESYQKRFEKKHKDKDASLACFEINRCSHNKDEYKIKTGYFIGLDWIEEGETAIHVTPKYNNNAVEVDYISMLLSSLRHDSVTKEIDELFEVEWSKPNIDITQKQDLLTPFLIVEFLSLLKQIVRKGLKNSYYKVENNLYGKVKGKIQVSKTIKKNLVKSKDLFTYCSYEEFGVNNKENRLLKKALALVKGYLPTYSQLTNNKDLKNMFNYINPAFERVSDQIELSEIRNTKINVFYKEYEQALKLAKLILKRFGYNISNTKKDSVQSPPFWIDMTKLFELYVLGLLKDRFQNEVKFQKKYQGNELDYLLKNKDYQMVIDAKYKPLYLSGVEHNDIRQVSGYARLKRVYEDLKKEKGAIIDCLIIHPDLNGFEDLSNVDLKQTEIKEYHDVYKIGVKLPLIKL